MEINCAERPQTWCYIINQEKKYYYQINNYQYHYFVMSIQHFCIAVHCELRKSRTRHTALLQFCPPALI